MSKKPMIRIAALLLAGGACSRMEDRQLTIGNVTYSFPANHVFRFTNPEEGHPFARIRPPAEKFDLIYSEFSKLGRNYQGNNLPLVTSINDHSASGFREFNFPGGVTVCREDQPYYSCGLNISDGDVVWSVIFNKDQIQNSELIRAAAQELIQNYRG